VKKSQIDSKKLQPKHPRTELDVKFLAAVAQYMSKQGVSSDRAMSLALGRSENFLNRVRNGYQSATPEAWSALLDKYPEAQNVTTTNVMAQGSGQAVGTVHGDNHYSATTLHDCQQELAQSQSELTAAKIELEQLRQQVTAQAALLESKDALLASRDEIISLLRGGYNRPN